MLTIQVSHIYKSMILRVTFLVINVLILDFFQDVKADGQLIHNDKFDLDKDGYIHLLGDLDYEEGIKEYEITVFAQVHSQ